jgi:hypothetical protein
VGTTRGTSTDVDGNYSIEVPAGSTQLRCAYTGYAEQVVALGSANVQNFALKAGSVLDEVVVIGYGVARKSDLTGSVASVNEKNFNKGLVTAPDQLIQGEIPGVQVINNSGQPGGATTVRIAVTPLSVRVTSRCSLLTVSSSSALPRSPAQTPVVLEYCSVQPAELHQPCRHRVY